MGIRGCPVPYEVVHIMIKKEKEKHNLLLLPLSLPPHHHLPHSLFLCCENLIA